VGFPGETEEDFAETLALAEEVGFDNAFVFRYSQRRDTPAALMENQIPEAVKERRNKDLLAVIDRHCAEKLATLVGGITEILCEGPSKNNPARLTGRTRTNKIVVFEGEPRHVGEIFPVQVVRASGNTLYGDPAILNV